MQSHNEGRESRWLCRAQVVDFQESGEKRVATLCLDLWTRQSKWGSLGYSFRGFSPWYLGAVALGLRYAIMVGSVWWNIAAHLMAARKETERAPSWGFKGTSQCPNFLPLGPASYRFYQLPTAPAARDQASTHGWTFKIQIITLLNVESFIDDLGT